MFKPKFITFDCYGTLINFEMGPAARRVYGARLSPEIMDGFRTDFAAFCVDELLGAWKPYDQVIADAVGRTCKRWKIAFDPADAVIFPRLHGHL